MMEALSEFVLQLVAAAVHDLHFIEVVHAGPPARYTMRGEACECGGNHIQREAVVLCDGQSISIRRSARLIVEPCDKLVARPVHIVIDRWETV